MADGDEGVFWSAWRTLFEIEEEVSPSSMNTEASSSTLVTLTSHGPRNRLGRVHGFATEAWTSVSVPIMVGGGVGEGGVEDALSSLARMSSNAGLQPTSRHCK